MGIFFEKPSKVPDVTGGGISPIKDRARAWNRTGTTLLKGEVVQFALTPGEASEVATNDENSYVPGASNDTVWNTVIDPISSTAVGSSIQRGGIFGVVLDESVADNSIVTVQTFGIVEAFCASSGTVQPGDPLVPTITNSLFNPCPTSNSIIATYIDVSDTSLTARELHRVFLHQGLFAPHRSPAALS